MEHESRILNTWQENANTWALAIRDQLIASRAVTNPAVQQAIRTHIKESVLDIGCGEGWLSRSMMAEGYEIFGLDGSAELIAKARELSGTECYAQCTYGDIISWHKFGEASEVLDDLKQRRYGGAVFNFCLYEKDGVEELLRAVMALLQPEGRIVIQTLHPHAFKDGDAPYESRWVADSWKGLSGGFTNGHPWYFRTLEDWFALIHNAGLTAEALYEPKSPGAVLPSSVIFVIKDGD